MELIMRKCVNAHLCTPCILLKWHKLLDLLVCSKIWSYVKYVCQKDVLAQYKDISYSQPKSHSDLPFWYTAVSLSQYFLDCNSIICIISHKLLRITCLICIWTYGTNYKSYIKGSLEGFSADLLIHKVCFIK